MKVLPYSQEPQCIGLLASLPDPRLPRAQYAETDVYKVYPIRAVWTHPTPHLRTETQRAR